MECASLRCAKRCRMWILLDVVLICASTISLCGASLIKSPINKAVIAGQRMEMECQTDNRSVFRKWDFSQTGSDSIRTLAINDSTNIAIVPNISGFDVNVDNNGSIVLYSNSAETNDAGVYICQGDTGQKGSTEFKYSAQLIVLESEPICETNLTMNVNLSNGDYIWMECRVNLGGNWAPTMEWRQHSLNGNNNEGRLVSNATVIIENTSIVSTLIVLIDATNNVSHYSCRTYFTWHNGSLKTNATNIPDFRHTWTTHSATKSIRPTWPTTSVNSTTAKSEVTFEFVLLLFGLLSAALFLVMIATVVACCVIIRRKTAEWMAEVVSTYENRERPTSTRNSLRFSRDTLRRQTKVKSLDRQVERRERQPFEGYTSVDDLEEECCQAARERPTTSVTPKYTSVFKKLPPVPTAREPVPSAHYSLAVDDEVVLDYATLRKDIEPPKWDSNHDSADSESESEDLK